MINEFTFTRIASKNSQVLTETVKDLMENYQVFNHIPAEHLPALKAAMEDSYWQGFVRAAKMMENENA